MKNRQYEKISIKNQKRTIIFCGYFDYDKNDLNIVGCFAFKLRTVGPTVQGGNHDIFSWWSYTF